MEEVMCGFLQRVLSEAASGCHESLENGYQGGHTKMTQNVLMAQCSNKLQILVEMNGGALFPSKQLEQFFLLKVVAEQYCRPASAILFWSIEASRQQWLS